MVRPQLILVADGDADIAAAIEVNLVLEGYEVHVVHDGIAALEAARTARPALVILDVVMPEMDGVAVCEAMRSDSRTQQIPVVLLTAKTMKEDRLLGLRVGADDYITKPFEAPELVARVRNLIDRTSRMRDVSPLTGLPGNFQIAQELERRVQAGVGLTVLYCDLSGFKAYNDHYGFLRGDEVIKFTADVLRTCAEELAGPDAFIGHVGGDDFVLVMNSEVAERTAAAAIEHFDAGIVSFYDAEDLECGHIETIDRQGVVRSYPVVTLAIGIATTAQRPLTSQWEASVVASEMKNHAKREGRSAFAVDRRTES